MWRLYLILVVTFCVITIRYMGAEEADRRSNLFNGKTLVGWEGNLNVFRVRDGAIVGGTLERALPHNEFLCTKRVFSDFELRLKAKLIGQGRNAGVQFRSRRKTNHHEVIGYQADIGESRGDLIWGCLYDESRRRIQLATPPQKAIRKIVKINDWNDYVIRCQGKQVQLFVNGVMLTDYTERDDSLEQKGIIGLQIHGGPPAEAWYKDITIEEL